MVLTLTKLLSPLLCLSLAALLLWHSADLPPEQQALLTQLPYLFCGLAAVMALLANHLRELATALLMGGVYGLIRQHLQASLTTEPAGQIFQLISLCLPALLAMLMWLPETGWRHRLSLSALLTAPLLLALTSALFAIDPLWFSAPTEALLNRPFYGLKLSQPAGWLFAGVAAMGLALLVWRGGNTESSLLGCTLLASITFGWFQQNNISAAMFSCAGLLLIVNQLRHLLNLSYRDELTQIPNRRALHKAARALGNHYSLAMVDIDHFKKINDTHGHDLGDQVLKVVAAQLRKVGGGGKVYRYGGEEFCLLFRGKSAAQVEQVLQTLRQTIAEYDMVMRDQANRPRQHSKGAQKRGATRRKSDIRLTVSVGVADSAVADGVFQAVMKAADSALYGAKRGGRNRVVMA